MAYKYDVFFSYKHFEEGKSWIIDFFLKHLIESLERESNRKISVFLDLVEFDPGESDINKLTLEIGKGLGYSRCMVAAWSPSYFTSKWCWCECQSFAKRINTASAWSPLFPVIIFNGERFPPMAGVTHWLDLREYFRIGMKDGSPMQLRCKRIISEAAGQLSKTIQSSPEWSKDWISEEWFNNEPPSNGPVITPSF